MVVSRQGDLRANQKERTRTALVEAAAAFLREGTAPTVPEAAERAKVSRATAYRYFPTQESLLMEATFISPSVEPVERMLSELVTDDVELRLTRLVDAFNPIVVDEETQMRTALGVYLDSWLENRRTGGDTAVREGRRTRWLDEVLAPARRQLSKAQYRRLRAALSLTIGIEATVVMRDVCHLDNDELLATLRWAATSLLDAALNERTPPGRPARSERGLRRTRTLDRLVTGDEIAD